MKGKRALEIRKCIFLERDALLLRRPRFYPSENQYFERTCVDNPRAAPRTAAPLWGAIILEENVPWR